MRHAQLRCWPPRRPVLLDFDLGAGGFELGLGGRCGLLVDLLEDGLGGRVDEVLGFLEAEAREGTDFLDDLDLLTRQRR